MKIFSYPLFLPLTVPLTARLSLILCGSAHVAQHATLASGSTQPPASAMTSHDVNCAYSSPIFAVSSAIRCAGASMHAPPGAPLTVPNAAHRATIERRAIVRSIICGGGGRTGLSTRGAGRRPEGGGHKRIGEYLAGAPAAGGATAIFHERGAQGTEVVWVGVARARIARVLFVRSGVVPVFWMVVARRAPVP